jgi:aminoglycoside phosphotransferase (APT) family kinase protein
VLKVIRDGGAGTRWPAASEASHPYYWRREALAYGAGLAARFGAPACRACIERDDGSVALWLDDVEGTPAWTPELLGEVARRLGRVQAALASAPPDDDWLSRDWLRAYLVLHDVALDEAVLERLAGAGQTICHHDLHPGNVLGSDGTSVIDWAYCGHGAFGLDAGVLVADGLADGAFDPALAPAVEQAVWSGYLAGLADAGATVVGDDVRFAFARGTALRLSWLPPGRRPAWDATIDFLQRLASDA